MPKSKKFPFHGRRLFGCIVTTCFQSQGAPIVDSCHIQDEDGNRYKGIAIHLFPWRKNQYGDREMGRALCIGRKS